MLDRSAPSPYESTKDLEAWSLDALQNVGHCITETAKRMPNSIAVAAPQPSWQGFLARISSKAARHQSNTKFDTITFAQLEAYSNQIARGLLEQGLKPGTRIALMVPPGIEFVAWVFGLFKAGMVIILIDPGMGRKNMIGCLAEAEPAGLVGIPLAHAVRIIFRSKLPQCRYNIVLGHWPGCIRAACFKQLETCTLPPSDREREQAAAIIFTTGSTGPPKGVLYRHRIFIEQARQIRDYFQIKPGTVDISGFPLFALFNTAMGTTTVFPRMDATRPAAIHPPEFIHAINTFGADQSFGSPALWNTVSKYCKRHLIKLPTIKRVLSAGAPVPTNLLQRIKDLISSDGDAYTPYGATESLPVACISATEVLSETAHRSRHGAGTCVGRRFPDIEWQVIRITDTPLSNISECEILPKGEIGELIVQGSVVTDQYVTRQEANAEHKIRDGASFWHRMGDVGYLDDQDRFWFCGRKSHRVITADGTSFPIPCEAIFNNHPKIYRSALVGIPLHLDYSRLTSDERTFQIPVIVAEPFPEHWSTSKQTHHNLIAELKELARQNPLTQSIEHVLLHKSLPVDIRHNSKIFREKLRPWAKKLIDGGR